MSSLSLTNHGKKKRGGRKVMKQIPKGDVLTDSFKKNWIIHSSIARGGFGEIYTASKSSDSVHQNYVIKIVSIKFFFFFPKYLSERKMLKSISF